MSGRFRTFETVPTETAAWRATSFMLTRRATTALSSRRSALPGREGPRRTVSPASRPNSSAEQPCGLVDDSLRRIGRRSATEDHVLGVPRDRVVDRTAAGRGQRRGLAELLSDRLDEVHDLEIGVAEVLEDRLTGLEVRG